MHTLTQRAAYVACCVLISISAHCSAVDYAADDSTLAVHSPATAMLTRIQRLGAWFTRPRHPLDVNAYLPTARPHQPWPYRAMASAQHVSITVTNTHALKAVITHAPLPGVTADMMAWWWNNIDGEATYVGDGKTWSKYLQWHPRDHIHHITLPHPNKAGSTPHHTQREICEFFMCSSTSGYTTHNYQADSQQVDDYVIKEVTEDVTVGSNNYVMTVPTRLGIGLSCWHLQHAWRDTPEGLVVASSQVVGVEYPGWRPLWYTRWRNALLQGLYSRGRDPVWMLQQWLHHCVEEVGNLEHILPSLFYSAQPAGQQPTKASKPVAREGSRTAPHQGAPVAGEDFPRSEL